MGTTEVSGIRLLAPDPQAKGDLFARLAADVLLSLGYENPRMSVHKTGREIDIKARHRLEDKLCVAECKAQKRPVGGSDLNKFAGVLERESKGAEALTTQGYFISLSGFRESALEQEEEGDGARFILLDGYGVQEQLVAGGMVVSPDKVCELAGRIATKRQLRGDLSGRPQLIAHPLGWLWLCEFERNHEVTHFSIIHADGRSLTSKIAMEVIAADPDLAVSFGRLSYVGTDDDAATQAAISKAERKYIDYLRSELGEITLEGLPADEEVGARHIALEDLYVPLRVEPATEERQRTEDAEISKGTSTLEVDESEEEDGEQSSEEQQGESLGSALVRDKRLAILAAPGAGKSTLIKRLAVAYADPEKRGLIEDELPNEEWLPVFIRCRTLGQGARDPIWRILDEIPNRGEFPEASEGFHELVAGSLREGKVLLLIDGLDEISDPGERIAFVRQLRTFLGTYPKVSLVLTSRERGFRTVAGAMSSMCEWYTLAEFEDDDIRQLTRAWHQTVVGKSAKVVKDAEALASTIIETDRVRRLARNPLLLTTLLLVKRWVGALPRKRTVLYEKAIEVLLMTWNVEAHEPIDREEAIPQLAFVAHAMTSRGEQSLSSVMLAELLVEAREQMPEILGFAQTSVSQFVEQIESRSSLLVMTGHVEDSGTLVPNYEFRHLTFQEYLTAVALVEGFYKGHSPEDSLVGELAPHFQDPEWLEVISLANVRAGREASSVISELLARLEKAGPRTLPEELGFEAEMLARALGDEVQLPPDLVKATAQGLGRSGRLATRASLVSEILEGRYGPMFRDVVKSGFFEDEDPNFGEFGSAFAILLELQEGRTTVADGDAVERVTKLLGSGDERGRTEGALRAMEMAFRSRFPREEIPQETVSSQVLRGWSKTAVSLARSSRPSLAYASAWALVWLNELGTTDPEDSPEGLRVMVELWRDASSPLLQKMAAWACATLPEIDRSQEPLGKASPEMCAFIEEQAEIGQNENKWREDRWPAALLLGYYLQAPWSDDELAERARNLRSEKVSVLKRLRAQTAPTAS
jgi:hypothetical protein